MAVAVTAGAQDVPRAFEFAFTNPGARSMGFGGAFVAVADDATAAFANPAGLVQILRPELSAELRVGLSANGSIGDTTPAALTGLTYFSFVYPGRLWSLAVYGHRLARLELGLGSSTGFFGGRSVAENLHRYLGADGTTELDITRWAVAGGYRVNERLSLGIGVSYFRGAVDVTADAATAPWWSSPIPGWSPTAAGDIGTNRSDSTDWGLNAGFLWSVSRQWNLGGFYREGPTFRVPGLGEGPRSISLPGTYGLGGAFRDATGALTLAFEWDHVTYSSLAETLAARGEGGSGSALADADELHLGGEYAFLSRSPIIAVRFGAWLDPNHGRYTVVTSTNASKGDELHIAAGVGWAFKRFQIDLGLDASDRAVALSASGIYSF
jgi:long-chain fatty acid transport protein